MVTDEQLNIMCCNLLGLDPEAKHTNIQIQNAVEQRFDLIKVENTDLTDAQSTIVKAGNFLNQYNKNARFEQDLSETAKQFIVDNYYDALTTINTVLNVQNPVPQEPTQDLDIMPGQVVVAQNQGAAPAMIADNGQPSIQNDEVWYDAQNLAEGEAIHPKLPFVSKNLFNKVAGTFFLSSIFENVYSKLGFSMILQKCTQSCWLNYCYDTCSNEEISIPDLIKTGALTFTAGYIAYDRYQKYKAEQHHQQMPVQGQDNPDALELTENQERPTLN